jgi:hypothetical protein
VTKIANIITLCIQIIGMASNSCRLFNGLNIPALLLLIELPQLSNIRAILDNMATSLTKEASNSRAS